MPLIELKNVEFKYAKAKSSTLAVPSFLIEKSEKVFLYGPSGGGKTTLLEILAGVLAPQSGSVRLLDQDLAKMSALQRDQFRAAHIGYIFQSFNLIPYLNVEENITLPLALSAQKRAKVPRNLETEEVRRICEHLGILELLKNPVTELSVGQQQRVAVARALLGRPEIILADEPTSSLDFDHREKFVRLLFDLCKEHQMTLLFVSHDRSLQNLFDRSVSLLDIHQAGRS